MSRRARSCGAPAHEPRILSHFGIEKDAAGAERREALGHGARDAPHADVADRHARNLATPASGR